MARRKPTCFVVMPFGKKVVGDIEIDFDLTYEKYIKEAGKLARCEISRADTDEKGGLIIPRLMAAIRNSDLVVADVTYYNPNVYYELGVRHALSKHGTILIRRKSGDLGIRKLGRWSRVLQHAYALYSGDNQKGGIPTPFDINGLKIWPYDFSNSTLEGEIRLLSDRMLAAAGAIDTDSPVFQNLPNLGPTAGTRPASGRQDHTHEIIDAPGESIGSRSGDIANLTGGAAVRGNPMADIFISFKTEDTQRVRPIYDGFRGRALSVFWSNDIPKGAPNYQAIIKEELLRAPVVVVVWTHNSVHSGPVAQECSQAERGNKLFQILLDDIEPIDFPMEARFKAQKTMLLGWTGDTGHPEWSKLNDAIDARLGRRLP